MSSFRNILFPFDSKIRPDDSFAYVIDLANQHQSTLIFLHTLRLNSNPKQKLSAAELKKDLEEDSGKRLESIKSRFNLDQLKGYEFHTEIGFLSSRVILKVKDHPIDLLVIEKELLEEMGEDAHNITCPIMIIP